nr:flocculation protein FLO11-like [Ipomoea batatas]
MTSKKNKKSKTNKKHMPSGERFAGEIDECRRLLYDVILRMMDKVCEVYGDPQRHQQTRRECAVVMQSYADYAEATTGEQYMFDLQSKYSSGETVVEDTSVDDSIAAAIDAYVKQAQFMTGDQFMLNFQSKYSSDETVVKDTFVDESMAADIEACAENAENAEVINTGDQYIFNSQSKYSSETVVVEESTKATVVEESTEANVVEESTKATVVEESTEANVVEESTKATVVEESTEANVVEESTEAAESSDHKTFANLFEELVDKLNDMAGLLPVSKTGKAKAKEGDDVNVKVREKEKEKDRSTLIKSGSDAKGSATDGENEDLVGLEEQLLKMRFQSLHQNNRYISSIFEYNGGINVSTNLGTEKKIL